MSEEVTINNEHKDRLFTYIFGSPENKKWTLSLYNGVNKSSHTDENAISFNTIKDALYMGMRNDTSFLLMDTISVYEHQSTYNPNMPLRQLQYLGHLYEGYITTNKLNKFSDQLLELPVPKLVVFYNGLTEKEDEIILKLSDSFKKDFRDNADVEVRVRMLNINHGHNKELMNACKPLAEYAWFIDRIRENHKKYAELANAVDAAINEMPSDFVIRPFLFSHRAEVRGMLLSEYNEAEVMELFKEDGKREGRAEGISEVNDLYSWLKSEGRTDDILKAVSDKEYQNALFKEYHEWQQKNK